MRLNPYDSRPNGLLPASPLLSPLPPILHRAAIVVSAPQSKIFRRLGTSITGWAAAFAVLILRLTCRVRLHDDPRPALRSAGRNYIYAVLHAHQIAAIIDAERGTGALVSRSADGQILIPSLRVRGIVPIRGSSNRRGRDKGGRLALDALIKHVHGGRPAYLAVDGPRGPRGCVHRGVALLSQRTGAAVVLLAPIPSRRWILTKTWDRLQIPKPFSVIDGYFAAVIQPEPEEPLSHYGQRIEDALADLERKHDPGEASPQGEHP